MTRSDLEQSDGRAFRLTATLLPVAKRVNADLESARELFLAEAYEAPKEDDVSTRFDLSLADAPPDRGRNHPSEIGFRQLRDVEVISHW
jgi:hypothetical protein